MADISVKYGLTGLTPEKVEKLLKKELGKNATWKGGSFSYSGYGARAEGKITKTHLAVNFTKVPPLVPKRKVVGFVASRINEALERA